MKCGKAKKKGYGYCVFQVNLTYGTPISFKISKKQPLGDIFSFLQVEVYFLLLLNLTFSIKNKALQKRK